MKYVYRIFDAAGDLLYVGQTQDVANRMAAHAAWLGEHPGHQVRVEGPVPSLHATVLERRAIMTERPKRNKQWRNLAIDPTIACDVTIRATVAARYLVGAEPRVEGWATQIVEGYGLDAAERPKYGDPSYRLLDIEAKYLELAKEMAA